jgi:transcriptional regulator with XRE-family HTH domain
LTITETIGECLRQLRQQKGMSVRNLAERTDFSPSFISQIENGQVSPSIASMEKIAAVLGVALWEFFNVAAKPRPDIIRVDERSRLSLGWSRATIHSLGYLSEKAQVDAVIVALEPRGVSGRHPTAVPRDEFAFIHEGEILLTLEDDDHLLKQGDSVVIPAGVRRRWRNDGTSSVEVLIISVGPKQS